MKHTTKKIVDVFPDLRIHFDKRSYNDEAVLSTLEPVKRTFLQLGGFFEQPEEEFNLALLNKHLDNDWLEFALELITEYFRKDTYLIQKPTYSLIREGSHYKSMSQFADYLSEQGLRYDRQKLNLYFERGKVPHPDLVVGGVKYWSDETVQTYAEQEINRMGSIQQEAKK